MLKPTKPFIIFILATLPAALVSWFVIGDRIEVKAQSDFNKRFDLYYPVKHSACSTKVEKTLEKLDSTNNNIKEMKSELRFLVLLEQQRMTWNEKQAVVDALVKTDSFSYGAAYEFINKGNKK